MTLAPLPHFLQMTEGVTSQRVALRIDPEEIELVEQALELFLREPQELIAKGQLLPEALTWFLEIGECLFDVIDDGQLGPLNQGLRLYQGPEPIAPFEPLLFERRPCPSRPGAIAEEVMIADVIIDRRDYAYDRDWQLFHLRKMRQGKQDIDDFLLDATTEFLGREHAAEAERALTRRNEEDKELLFRASAHRVFNAPFELYSRFVGRHRLIKDGLDTIRHILAGDGGACSEKAQAMKLIADALEIPASYLFAGPEATGEVPVDSLLEILDTFDVEYSHAVQAYWNHLSLIVELKGREVLVDASNGNIPFLWVTGDELTAMLDRRGKDRRAVSHRYVVGRDDLYYHRVEQTVPEQLLFALELGWADPHVDLVQAVDDELGLLTMPDLWLGLLPYRNDKEREIIHEWYDTEWLKPGLIRGVLFSEDPAKAEDPLAEELRSRYPRAAQAAIDGHRTIETRLEEANPGEGYRVEFVVVGRKA